jgi:hypothetical protein
MRNISFALTTEQFLDGSKTVTRRVGWLFLKQGDVLCAVRKCQGLKPGEKLDRLGKIRVTGLRRERLGAITAADVAREGFFGRSPEWFIEFFCGTHVGCERNTEVARIEFERVAHD